MPIDPKRRVITVAIEFTKFVLSDSAWSLVISQIVLGLLDFRIACLTVALIAAFINRCVVILVIVVSATLVLTGVRCD